MYRAVAPGVDLPSMEREILRFWRDADVFHRSLAATQDGPVWSFYEGPPTANGQPGTHHVEARVFKDVFPRFKTMKGHCVPRRAGWDCHGLPVELAVERELGFSGKPDIEAYGVAEFNQRCRESVLRHVDAFAEMTRRMGYWVDMDDAYWTMNPDYVQSVWWSLKRIFDAGLLTQDYRVAPYCPRCGTGLSDHELAQGYEPITDPSVYVRFPVTGGTLAERFPGLTLLVWTTTPWTLVSNTAVAAKPDAGYIIARTTEGESVVVAEELAQAVLGEQFEVLQRLTGRDLERTPYARPFDLVDIPGAHFVVLGEYVTTDDGTGLVHLAPAFGADDLIVCREYGLPVVNPIRPDGTFAPDVALVGGVFFKTADAALAADLRERGLMFAERSFEHAYPHCWRCHTPLLYYAQPSWYIRTTRIKQRLLEVNEHTNWFPPTIKWGRYGDWLRNNVDWALSRNRYWGTPLPIWQCEDAHATCVGSLAELGELAGQNLTNLDPHRPFVDDVVIACPHCAAQGKATVALRVPEVIDCWYDSGAMPFAQWGYPHRNAQTFQQQFPADFICEAIDQTRGWFYTLMAISTLVFDDGAYRDVLCLGHILDADGFKMSKHRGNVLEPIPLMDAHGADAVRWFMLAAGSPWQARRVGHEAIADVVRKTLFTYWSTVSFQSLYGRIAGFEPGRDPAPAPEVRCSLDRWALSRAHTVAAGVDVALENYDTQQAGRLLAGFIDDLSNWYVRRSRRRFWNGDPAALATLHECLRVVTLLMAPFTPFVTERVWADLFRSTDPAQPDSVHLARWPLAEDTLIDPTLDQQMALVRRLVELGRAARASSRVRTRQPLSRILVAADGWEQLPGDLRQQVLDEINVLTVETLSAEAGDLVNVSVKANFRSLGRRFGNQTPAVAAAISAAGAGELARSLRDAGTALVVVEGESVEVGREDVVITDTPREGWTVAQEGGETVALDLTLTDELLALGIAREVVRFIQDARKGAGFEVTDRIALTWLADDPGSGLALRKHAAEVAAEVLAVQFREADPGADALTLPDLGLRLKLERVSQ